MKAWIFLRDDDVHRKRADAEFCDSQYRDEEWDHIHQKDGEHLRSGLGAHE
jgi:hypothetical protein